MFWKKNEKRNLDSSEYERVLKRISELDSTLQKTLTKIEILETNYNDLRGKFNRKLSGLKKEEEQEETESINTNNVILPYGDIFKGYR